MTTTTSNPTLTALTPVVHELSAAGHPVLAAKVLFHAAHTDLIIIRRKYAVRKYNRKLMNQGLKSIILETKVCGVLHNHQED